MSKKFCSIRRQKMPLMRWSEEAAQVKDLQSEYAKLLEEKKKTYAEYPAFP